MKQIYLLISLIIIVWVIAAFVGIRIYRDAFNMWEIKKEKHSFLDKVKYFIYIVLETKIFQHDKSHVDAAAQHIAGVYNHIAFKEPDLITVNQLLKEKTVLEIVDYMDGPGDRIFKVKLKATKSYKEHMLIISMKNITNQVRLLKEDDIYDKDDRKPRLRIIK